MRFYRLIKSNLDEYKFMIDTQNHKKHVPLFKQIIKNLETIKFMKLGNKEVIKILNLILFIIVQNNIWTSDNKIFAEHFQILYKLNFISPKDIKSTKIVLNCINGIYKAFNSDFFLELFTENVDEVFTSMINGDFNVNINQFVTHYLDSIIKLKLDKCVKMCKTIPKYILFSSIIKWLYSNDTDNINQNNNIKVIIEYLFISINLKDIDLITKYLYYTNALIDQSDKAYIEKKYAIKLSYTLKLFLCNLSSYYNTTRKYFITSCLNNIKI